MSASNIIRRVAAEIIHPRPLVVRFVSLRHAAVSVRDPISGRVVYGLSADLFRALDNEAYTTSGHGIDHWADVSDTEQARYYLPLPSPGDQGGYSALVIEPVRV